ncbi:MAG TPA: hypothetical protein VMW27_06135 [Thermoanaerobaculia bacterium]|nr:hypothetical protein [Thermoanaerobaculia bacterium]
MRSIALIRHLSLACALTLLAATVAGAAPLTFKDLMVEISTDDILRIKKFEVIEDLHVIDGCSDLNIAFCTKEVWQESWISCVRQFPSQEIVAYECGARRTETHRCVDRRWQVEVSYADDNRYCIPNPYYQSLCGTRPGRVSSQDVLVSRTGC